MKPSDEIEKIRKQLANKDWVQWGGNNISKESWDSDKVWQSTYLLPAIIEYLDRKEETICNYCEGTKQIQTISGLQPCPDCNHPDSLEV